MDYNITPEEMKNLAGRLKESTARATQLVEVLEEVIHSQEVKTVKLNGVEVPTLAKRVEDAVKGAVDSGILEHPKDKLISNIYINDDGELIVEYKDVGEEG